MASLSTSLSFPLPLPLPLLVLLLLLLLRGRRGGGGRRREESLLEGGQGALLLLLEKQLLVLSLLDPLQLLLVLLVAADLLQGQSLGPQLQPSELLRLLLQLATTTSPTSFPRVVTMRRRLVVVPVQPSHDHHLVDRIEDHDALTPISSLLAILVLVFMIIAIGARRATASASRGEESGVDVEEVVEVGEERGGHGHDGDGRPEGVVPAVLVPGDVQQEQRVEDGRPVGEEEDALPRRSTDVDAQLVQLGRVGAGELLVVLVAQVILVAN